MANGEAYPLFSVGDCRSVSPFPSDQLGISQTESTYPASERYEDKACVYPGIWLLDAQKQANLLVFLAGIGRYILMGIQLLITVPLIFIIFPQTEGWHTACWVISGIRFGKSLWI